MRVAALVNLLSNGLAEVEAKAHGDTLDQVESKALVDMQADTLVDMHGETFIDTLMHWTRYSSALRLTEYYRLRWDGHSRKKTGRCGERSAG